MKEQEKPKESKHFLYWTPRILAILFIAFISLFALDVFGEYTGFNLLIALFMHLIPTFILVIILAISWKKEKWGGWFFIILGIIFTIFFNTYKHHLPFLLISGPLFLVGALFLLNHHKGGKNETKKRRVRTK